MIVVSVQTRTAAGDPVVSTMFWGSINTLTLTSLPEPTVAAGRGGRGRGRGGRGGGRGRGDRNARPFHGRTYDKHSATGKTYVIRVNFM